MLELNFNPFPTLTTERLTLRQLQESDVNEMFVLRSDDRVMKFIDRPKATTIDEVLKFISLILDLGKNNESILWGITLTGEEKIVGTICIWNIDRDNYRGEVGYVLLPEYFGKGIMNEAMQKVLDYGFQQLKLHSMEADVNPGNTASIKLLERNGFVQEAYFKEKYFFNGEFKDTVILSLLARNHRNNTN